jgi:hypothetical protein
LRAQWNELFKVVHSEKLGEMAAEFDRVHCVQRALEVGALSYIIPPAKLRPYLIHAIERGMAQGRGIGEPQIGNSLITVECKAACKVQMQGGSIAYERVLVGTNRSRRTGGK